MTWYSRAKSRELANDARKADEQLAEKNKDILDSITYAKRLQDAILPPLSTIKKYLPDSFVLFKPKDIVAGDFYWMEKVGDTILYGKYSGTELQVEGQDYLIMRESDIFAIL